MSEETQVTKPEVMRNSVEDSYERSRMVKLSGDYLPPIVEMFASMDENTCDLMSVSSSRKPKMFRLKADEMDALVKSWLQFKADVATAKEAEKKHAEECKAEAFKIVEECPEIKIGDDCGGWYISMEKVPFKKYAHTPDQLLEIVTEAHNIYQEHKKNIDEVRALCEQHPEIKTKTQSYSYTAQKTWTVVVPSYNWESSRCDTSEELLKTVKYAVVCFCHPEDKDNGTQPLDDPKTSNL